jgi:hypothetical protein
MMDHAINALFPFLDAEMDELRFEWTSCKYRKLSDCPSYQAAKALIEAIHRLERYYYGESRTISIREQLRW